MSDIDEPEFYDEDGAPLGAHRADFSAAAKRNDTTDLDLELCAWPDNDHGNAERLEARYPAEIWWTTEWGPGVWDGQRFDFTHGESAAGVMAQTTARRMLTHESAAFFQSQRLPNESDKDWEQRAGRFFNWCKRSGDNAKTEAMLKQHKRMKTRPLADFDPEPDVLVTQNGVLVLHRNGRPFEFIEGGHDPARLNTRVTAAKYDAGASAPEFERFLERVQPDPEVRKFLYRFHGYCLTGHIAEQAYLIYQGKGGDGKSTFLNAIEDTCGGYVDNAAIESFLKHDKRGNEHSADIARLATGARLVKAAEPEQGARFAEAMLKSVTGGERLVARAMYLPPFEFLPQWKLVISCNRKPVIKGSDRGIWRRTLVCPWPESLERAEMDKTLPDRLRAEASGILNLLLGGWEDWLLEGGLAPPKAVVDATEEYRLQSDPFGVWFDEGSDTSDKAARTPATVLYDSYCGCVRAMGGEPMSQNAFGRALSERNLERERGTAGVRMWIGVRLTAIGEEYAREEKTRREEELYGTCR